MEKSGIEDMLDKDCKIENHEKICLYLHELYKAKNSDYGDSFSTLRHEFPNAILIRLGDKYNRLKSLMSVEGGVPKILDESIEDTLLDLANYCIMEVVERIADRGEHFGEERDNKIQK